jgi:hypothetical protein
VRVFPVFTRKKKIFLYSLTQNSSKMKSTTTKIVFAACFALALVFTLLPGVELLSLALAFIPIVEKGEISEGLLANVRRWHGTIDEQFANVDNVVKVIDAHKNWEISNESMGELRRRRDAVQALNAKCTAKEASPGDRRDRVGLLKTAVGYCLLQIKLWAYTQFNTGLMTREELHSLHFLLPGETGGHRSRAEQVTERGDAKVTVLSEDMIHVTIIQSAGEGDKQVARGWPHGVRQALIVITEIDGKTEVLRKVTTHLRNEIKMPIDARGKEFTIKIAFLRHPDDEPVFGSQPTFSMPLNTNDILAAVDHHHQEELEEQLREIEHHRRDVERLEAELEAKKRELTEAQKKSQK